MQLFLVSSCAMLQHELDDPARNYTCSIEIGRGYSGVHLLLVNHFSLASGKVLVGAAVITDQKDKNSIYLAAVPWISFS